jgi:hypothetical protein
MSIVLMLELPGMTPRTYEEINERIGFPASAPEGLEAHIAGVEETGMRVVDVWESEDQFQSFLRDTMLPAMAEVDGEEAVSSPKVRELQLHDRWSA